jgi:biopolymer transport protein ExbD
MTTRPLDLATRLRARPANLDWLFFVNGGLIVLFFYLFGSQFVLAPSLGTTFRLPEMVGANTDAQPATHNLSVTDSGQIMVADGSIDLAQLSEWLETQAAKHRQEKHAPAVLLVRADRGVPTQVWTQILGLAQQAGFAVRLAVVEPKNEATVGQGGR